MGVAAGPIGFSAPAGSSRGDGFANEVLEGGAVKIIGLTGGIASGKSTAAQALKSLGVPVIDADQLSRLVVEPARPAHEAIAHRWPEVVRPDQTLDRARLGAIVFEDRAQLSELTSLVMPAMIDEFHRQVGELERRGESFCVLEAATLFEEGLERLVDGVLVIALPEAQQLQRLKVRNGYTEPEARARFAAQLPLHEKVRRARWVVDNSGDEAELARRVEAVWERIKSDCRP